MPLPRLINLIWFAYIEGKAPEEEADIRKRLFEPGVLMVPSPTVMLQTYNPLTRTIAPRKRRVPVASEPQKKTLGTKTGYVPAWWRGEQAAYESAKSAMTGISGLPKMKK